MGIFNRLKTAVAGVDADSINNARLGRGVIVSVQPTGTAIKVGTIEQRVCAFQVEVALDDTAPYVATCRQRIPIRTMTNAAGLPLFAFALTVIPASGGAYHAQVGNPVPNEALAFVFPGSQLPAKVMPGQPNSIAIDWASVATPANAGM